MTTAATGEKNALPTLREDLELREGAATAEGAPSWLIYDPLQHRYFQIDRMTFEVLSLWRKHTSPSTLSGAVRVAFGHQLETSEIAQLTDFLKTNQLTSATTSQDWQRLANVAKQRHSMMQRLAHNYLFFKVPLCNPDTMLRQTLPLVAPIFTRAFAIIVLLIGIVGLYFVSRQWDAFLASGAALLTLEGAGLFAVTLFAVKVLHELGHAYTAIRFGCRVPSIGLAFMMMAPLLYADVTDAWRLGDRRKRLLIDAAGVIVELGVACIATLLWVFLPDGTIRQVAFLLATTSWIMSIGVNLNPLMRFDGYYILGDLIKIENLQARAFDFGVWRMRELLLGLGAPPPETLSRRLQITLTLYAWTIWLYRLVLFTGIALVVYHYFFKLLGVVLFAFEIVYFLGRPIYTEARVWWLLRSKIPQRRRMIACVGTVATLLFLLVPWSTSIPVPAIVEARDFAHVYPPRIAMVRAVSVKRGDTIDAKTVLVELDAPELTHERRLVDAKLRLVRFRLARRGVDGQDRDDNLVLEGELAALHAREKGLAREQAELMLRAPLDGRVMEINPEIHPGRWLSQREPVALVVGPHGLRVRGYLAEAGLARVKAGTRGRFVPEDAAGSALTVELERVSVTSSSLIEIADLASQYGGAVATVPDPRQRPVPSGAQYLVTMKVLGDATAGNRTMRGTVWLDGDGESIAAGIWRHVLRVLVRESGA